LPCALSNELIGRIEYGPGCLLGEEVDAAGLDAHEAESIARAALLTLVGLRQGKAFLEGSEITFEAEEIETFALHLCLESGLEEARRAARAELEISRARRNDIWPRIVRSRSGEWTRGCSGRLPAKVLEYRFNITVLAGADIAILPPRTMRWGYSSFPNPGAA
jgi:hypothetical protein